jgi:hypothetical protein
MERRQRRQLLAHAKKMLARHYTQDHLQESWPMYISLERIGQRLVATNATDKDVAREYAQQAHSMHAVLTRLEAADAQSQNES